MLLFVGGSKSVGR